MKVEDYMGVPIKLNMDGKFEAKKDGVLYTAESLAALKRKMIQKIEPITVFHESLQSEWFIRKIVVVPSTKAGQYREPDSREPLRSWSLYTYDPTVEEEANKIWKDFEALQERVRKLRLKLIRHPFREIEG